MKIRIKKQLNENNNVEQVFSLENMKSSEGWAKQLRFIFAVYKKFKKYGEDDSKFATKGDQEAYKKHKNLKAKYLDPVKKQEEDAFDYLYSNLEKAQSGEISVDELKSQATKKIKEAQLNFMNTYIAYAKQIENEKILLDRGLFKIDLQYLEGILESTRKTLKSYQEMDKKFAK